LNHEEKKALYSFLIIYTLSTFVLITIIAILYYNRGIVSIQDRCSMQMRNAALWMEKELMHAEMDHLSYHFTARKDGLRIGLFDTNTKKLYSNLKDNNIYFSKTAYSNNQHDYHIQKLESPILNVSYIIVENDGISKDRIKLITLIIATMLVLMVFVSFIGYYLSKILLRPAQSRIQKLNRFIRDSSHELNTPISALLMSASSLKHAKEINPRVINHISVSAKLISQIYNTLSFIAFNDVDERFDEAFDLRELVQESVRFFDEIAASKGDRISVSLEKTDVFLDKTRIQKIINNLLSNAIKYSYPKSKIEVLLKDYTLCIINQGEGIKKEDQKSIFKRFERRNSNEEGGFGIGLDIVQRICKEYDVQIKVESKLKEKTTFFLTFPRS